MTTIPHGHSVGYSILRTGEGSAFEACIVMAHVDAPRSLAYDPISRRLEVHCDAVSLALPEVPLDIGKLLTDAPARVLVVTTDALSAIRSSARADGLLPH